MSSFKQVKKRDLRLLLTGQMCLPLHATVRMLLEAENFSFLLFYLCIFLYTLQIEILNTGLKLIKDFVKSLILSAPLHLPNLAPILQLPIFLPCNAFLVIVVVVSLYFDCLLLHVLMVSWRAGNFELVFPLARAFLPFTRHSSPPFYCACRLNVKGILLPASSSIFRLSHNRIVNGNTVPYYNI